MTLRPPWVPSKEALDLSELAEPDPEIARARRQLEADLGCHVAAYRVGAAGRPGGLCEVFERARLTEGQLRRLHQVEEGVGRCLFVAYAKPLVRRTR